MSVNELSSGVTVSAIATDGSYLYVHSPAGLHKVGTGQNGTTPGQVYEAIKGYRAHERCVSLACIGGQLFYRSPDIAPAAFIVLSCQYLLEVGSVFENGKGSFPTADNTALGIAVPVKVVEEKDEKEDAKESTAVTRESLQARVDELDRQMDNCGSDDDEMDRIDQELNQALEALNQYDEVHGGGEDVEIATAASGGAAKPKAGPKKPKNERFSAVTSDGRFLYLLHSKPTIDKKTADAKDGKDGKDSKDGGDVPPAGPPSLAHSNSKTDEKGAAPGAAGAGGKTDEKKAPAVSIPRVEMSLNVFDPKSKLDACHTTTLRVSPGRPNSVLYFDSTATDSSSGLKKVAKTSKSGSGIAQITLGCPDHLNFDGAITMEGWFKLGKSAFKRSSYQGLFYHGDGNYFTYAYMTMKGLVVGTSSNFGSGQLNCPTAELDPTEWNHLAFVYEADKKQWVMYVNGNMYGQGASTVGYVLTRNPLQLSVSLYVIRFLIARVVVVWWWWCKWMQCNQICRAVVFGWKYELQI